MSAVASQITDITSISGIDLKKKRQSSASLAFVMGMNSPVTGESPTKAQ